MTDWAAFLACTVCGATRGKPCHTLSSGGPEALPPQYAERAHTSRPTTESAAAKRAAAPTTTRATPGSTRNTPARRAASRTEATVAAWQAKAAKQKGT